MSLAEELLAHTDSRALAAHLARTCAAPENQREIMTFAIRLGCDTDRARLRAELLDLLNQPATADEANTPDLVDLRARVAALRNQLAENRGMEPEERAIADELRLLKARRSTLLAEKSHLSAELQQTP